MIGLKLIPVLLPSLSSFELSFILSNNVYEISLTRPCIYAPSKIISFITGVGGPQFGKYRYLGLDVFFCSFSHRLTVQNNPGAYFNQSARGGIFIMMLFLLCAFPQLSHFYNKQLLLL